MVAAVGAPRREACGAAGGVPLIRRRMPLGAACRMLLWIGGAATAGGGASAGGLPPHILRTGLGHRARSVRHIAPITRFPSAHPKVRAPRFAHHLLPYPPHHRVSVSSRAWGGASRVTHGTRRWQTGCAAARGRGGSSDPRSAGPAPVPRQRTPPPALPERGRRRSTGALRTPPSPPGCHPCPTPFVLEPGPRASAAQKPAGVQARLP
jgi:hypothetical protein